MDLIKKTGEFIGLDIGTSSVKVVRLQSDAKGFSILDFDLREVPAKIQEDKTLLGLKQIIQDIFKEASSTNKKVNSLISGPGVITRRILIPPMPQEELLGAIKWAIKDQVPFDLDKSTIEFQVTGEITDADGIKKKEIVAVVVNEDILKKHISLIKDLGLEFQSISVLSFSLLNLVNIDERIKSNQITALIDIGADRTEIVLFKGKQLQFVRQITTAAGTITQALTGVIVSFPEKIELDYPEAEKIKRVYGIPAEDTNIIIDKKIPLSKIAVLMRPVLERLVNEIKRSLDYYRQEFKEEKVDRIILCGGGARLKRLDEFLAKGLDIKVEVITMPNNIYCDPSKESQFREELASLSVGLGLALGKGAGLNLLPSELKTEVKQIRAVEKSALRIISLVVVAIFILSFIWMNVKFMAFKRQYASLSSYWALLDKTTASRHSLDNRKLLFDEIISDEPNLSGALKAIGDIMPRTAELNYLKLDKEKEEFYLKGVVITTESNTEVVLADFLLSLESSAYFTKATLISSAKTDAYNLPAIEFELLVKLAKGKK